MSTIHLSTAKIQRVLAEEMEARGGQVTDTWDDGQLLLCRATLPQTKSIQPQDRVQRGVALKANPGQTKIYPYIFRQVCSNGAIMPAALPAQQQVLTADGLLLSPDVETDIREAIAACCDPAVFETSVNHLRTSVHSEIDMALSILPMLRQLSQIDQSEALVRAVLEQYVSEGDMSRYGLMNAVTAVARETPDPEQRWDLEELGGGIGANLLPVQPVDSFSAAPEGNEALLS